MVKQYSVGAYLTIRGSAKTDLPSLHLVLLGEQLQLWHNLHPAGPQGNGENPGDCQDIVLSSVWPQSLELITF